jgi:hypothetical protein
MSDTTTELHAGVEAAFEQPTFSLLSAEKLNEIYAAMIKLRALAARVEADTGKEAALAGALIDIRPGDALVSAQPDLLAEFFKGATLTQLAAWRKASAPSDEAAAACIADAAWERCKRGKREIVFALLPQAWKRISAWTELKEAVRRHRLPVVFVSFTSDLEDVAASETGLPAIPVDAEDAPAVYRVASESITRARNGCWPTLIECVTIVAEKVSDPLPRMEHYLRAKGFLKQSLPGEIRTGFAEELQRAGI